MAYAVLGEGKRLRPALAMASALAVGGRAEDGLTVGCAVELVHCFSLVHDDLPAIDNDDLRRGRPTLHRAYPESVAILAGDAVFALAFETVTKAGLDAERTCGAIRILSEATGGRGLVGGEVLDVLSEGMTVTLDDVRTIHSLKTSSLIAASCALGGLAGGANAGAVETLTAFGQHVGLAFQVVDDVLNETGTDEDLGKSVGSDRARCKATYPAVIGIDASLDVAQAELALALENLKGLGGDTGPLREIAEFCVNRKR